MKQFIITKVFEAVPIDDDAINAGQLHQRKMVPEDVPISRIVGPDERIEMGRNGPLSSDRVGRIEVVHGPMPSPVFRLGASFIPWHVMHHDQRLLGGCCVG